MNITNHEIDQGFVSLATAGRDLVRALDEETLEWRPEPGRWSIAECLEHIAVSVDVHLPPIDRALERARLSPRHPERGDGPGGSSLRVGLIEGRAVAADAAFPAPSLAQRTD